MIGAWLLAACGSGHHPSDRYCEPLLADEDPACPGTRIFSSDGEDGALSVCRRCNDAELRAALEYQECLLAACAADAPRDDCARPECASHAWSLDTG